MKESLCRNYSELKCLHTHMYAYFNALTPRAQQLSSFSISVEDKHRFIFGGTEELPVLTISTAVPPQMSYFNIGIKQKRNNKTGHTHITFHIHDRM
jgi:hypothetical protein